MKRIQTVTCQVGGNRKSFKDKTINFDLPEDLYYQIGGGLGQNGIDDISADILDLGFIIFQIEQQIPGFSGTNYPNKFNLKISLRRPEIWNKSSLKILEDILHFLGNADWEIKIFKRRKSEIPSFNNMKRNNKDRVILFSGGLDSTCGLISLSSKERQSSVLVSYYSRQKTLQKEISEKLGYETLLQFSKKWNGRKNRGHNFYYRAFLFFCLAIVVARSYNIINIYQFENGILAASVPPAPSWRVTRHANPFLHKMITSLFYELTGINYKITNPFLYETKKEEVDLALKKNRNIKQLLKTTESCWYYWSNNFPGGTKKPKSHCGMCIPCIVRRTTLLDDKYRVNMTSDVNINNAIKGIHFKAYYGFLSEIKNQYNSLSKFYINLPYMGKELINQDLVDISKLQKLFIRFAKEFEIAFRVKLN